MFLKKLSFKGSTYYWNTITYTFGLWKEIYDLVCLLHVIMCALAYSSYKAVYLSKYFFKKVQGE